jgi:hypothetical protein
MGAARMKEKRPCAEFKEKASRKMGKVGRFLRKKVLSK